MVQVNHVRVFDSPNAPLPSPTLLVGKNNHGLWVVRDPYGLRGGIFASRKEALRFATWDHGRPTMALLVLEAVEFDSGARA